MSDFVLYAHGGSGNHGCEALVRTTSKIINNVFGVLPSVISSHPDEDEKYINDIPLTFLKKGVTLTSAQRIKAKAIKSLTGSLRQYDKYELRQLFNTRDSICLSIGGDNYCYSDFDYYSRMNKYLNENKNKTILWGCSVEPDLLFNQKVIEDLKKYQLITARESITYEAMRNIGLNNVVYSPDSAFILEKQEVPLPSVFDSKVVGINLSPMVFDYESSNQIVLNNYIELIRYIIEKTYMNIALIPHVIWGVSDDLIPLKALYEQFKHTNRVALIDENKQLNCRQLKYIISKCSFMVTARTHASIAAYSTCVPTLVTGYSVKAKGIAKDIFGDYKGYVCPVQELSSENDLLNDFLYVVNNQEFIRQKLREFNTKKFGYFKTVEEQVKTLTVN